MLDFPATHRNKEVISQILGETFSRSKPLTLLELASGSGQHVCHFAKQFPTWCFQPSDLKPEHLLSIQAYVAHLELQNVLPPVRVDVQSDNWNLQELYDGILAINLIHISPWECTLGLFSGAKRYLKPGGKLYLYGAYRLGERHTSASNESFDAGLRKSDPSWGVRCLREVTKVALASGFIEPTVVQMPANNLSLIFALA